MIKITNYIKLLRPHHWIKNILIFAPLFFGGDILNQNYLIKSFCLFFAFSALSSCVYIINNIADRHLDCLHPVKQNRPIAKGDIPVSKAIILACFMFLVAAFLSTLFPVKTIIILGLYFTINLLYSAWLKHVVIVDIFLIASMYLMRVFAGGSLFDISPSHWLILCTFFLSLFLISGKRRAEFNALGGEQATTRKVMQFYNKDFLDHLLTITTTACLVTYSLYTVSMGNPYMIYSLFFVTFGLTRYLYLIYRYNIGQSPEQTILKDPWLIITILAWIGYNGVIFYIY